MKTLWHLAVLALGSCASSPAEFVETGHVLKPDPGPGPSGDEALMKFGMYPARQAIREALRAHLRDNFVGYDVAALIYESELALAAPEQTLTLEIIGQDPNGLGLLGNEKILPRGSDSRKRVKVEMEAARDASRRERARGSLAGLTEEIDKGPCPMSERPVRAGTASARTMLRRIP